MAPSLLIVVVTYNSSLDIESLLDSIPGALAGLEAQVVVVDNGSSDDTADKVARRSDCTLIKSNNDGYSSAINKGVAACPDADAILVLNPDLRLEPRSIPKLVNSLRDGVGIVVPKVLDADGQVTRSLRRFPTLGRASGLAFTKAAVFSEYVTKKADYAYAHEVDWALGAAMLVSGRVHHELHGWDESFFLYSEETDLCWRARDAGWRTMYVPEAVVTHIGGGSGTSDRIHAMQIINRVRFYRRHHHRLASILYMGLVILSELTWWGRGHAQSKTAIRMLLVPALRPPELDCSETLLPA